MTTRGYLDAVSVLAAATIANRGQAVTITGPAAGTYAIAVPAPVSAGEMLILSMGSTTGTNAVTFSLANFSGGSAATSASLNAAGETLVAIAAGGLWVIVAEIGVTLS